MPLAHILSQITRGSRNEQERWSVQRPCKLEPHSDPAALHEVSKRGLQTWPDLFQCSANSEQPMYFECCQFEVITSVYSIKRLPSGNHTMGNVALCVKLFSDVALCKGYYYWIRREKLVSNVITRYLLLVIATGSERLLQGPPG